MSENSESELPIMNNIESLDAVVDSIENGNGEGVNDRELLQHDSSLVRDAMATESHDEESLMYLSGDSAWSVRRKVALNPHAPTSVLLSLCQDEEELVQIAALRACGRLGAEHGEDVHDALALASQSDNWAVRLTSAALAIDSALLEVLAEDVNELVAETARIGAGRA